VPALLCWSACWGLYLGLASLGASPWIGLLAAAALGAMIARLGTTRWRRMFIGAGFPVSLVASGLGSGLPPWVWLLVLLFLLALYPFSTWRDAPLFPTPGGALGALAAIAPLSVLDDAPAGQILDAGCGLGHGLRELHAAYPVARLAGVEWSWPLTLACRLRCWILRIPAQVQRADMWRADWTPYAMVYLFQRPESMDHAATKAAAQLRPGAWLASLEFEASRLEPSAVVRCPDGRPLWLYQMPFRQRRG
jgi:F0F1-type ATP synthase membrane subunit c/vacuolar-type H+-ATPase subunit K